MTSKVTINRLPTGVPGLDEVLGGGIPEFSFNLIAGTPGCGKTTLAHQMMFSWAQAGRSALYFTVLGEPTVKMLRYQQQFDFFDTQLVNQSIHFVDLSADTLTGDLDQVLRRIVAAVRQHNPAVVFIDSFRSVVRASNVERQVPNDLPQFVQQLGMLMTGWQATTFLVGEYGADSETTPVFTVADGIIRLTQNIQRNSMVRKLEVVKMRGQATLPGLHTFRISGSGLTVYVPAGLSAAGPAVSADPPISGRAMLAVLRLDDMLGGGLPRGYSLLVAGPSGSGKSTLAASFLVEGVRIGETGVIAAFEQRPDAARTPKLAALIESGQISLVHARTPDLSIDEILHLVIHEVSRIKARRVVIDSLSGFELALAPTFREDFRESMARMVTTLSSTGVTVVMTSELEDRYIDLRFSPYGTAFTTDAIIVLRYIELDSRLRRVIAVVKVRASAHSNELREYVIDDDGIQIGEMPLDQEGLLTGSPTHTHAGDRRTSDPQSNSLKSDAL